MVVLLAEVVGAAVFDVVGEEGFGVVDVVAVVLGTVPAVDRSECFFALLFKEVGKADTHGSRSPPGAVILRRDAGRYSKVSASCRLWNLSAVGRAGLALEFGKGES